MSYLLLESGYHVLLESGTGAILLEDTGVIVAITLNPNATVSVIDTGSLTLNSSATTPTAA